jgi:energy-converting hydrogenase Eha subunit E
VSLLSKEGNAMKSRSNIALAFIGFVATCAAVMVGHSLLRMQPLHGVEFLTVFFLAVLSSRMKIKLPGLNGNMSVNLPFLLIAIAQLSLFEALLVASASTVAQCFPKAGCKPKPVQTLFNVSIVTVAVGLAALIFQHELALREGWSSGSLLLAIASATVFLVQTMPVATIISLTEGGRILRIWSSIFQLSFPYYVLSSGVTSMVTTVSRHVGWQVPLLILPAMYAVYRSYQLYFGGALPQAHPIAMAKGAGTTN